MSDTDDVGIEAIERLDDRGLTIQMLRDRLEDMEKRLKARQKELDSCDS